jgi:hypothetical protein
MAKIYASGNYVIVDDGTKIYEYAKGHTLYVLSDDIFYLKEITQGQYKVSIADLDAGNITAEDSGDVYTVNTFTTFLRENTGFKTASGGSGATPVGATLMQTGQTTIFRTGDDADRRAEGRDVDFFTLPSNNPFGNTNRFTDELGGQTYTNNIVIDWSTYNGATVLGYRRTTNGVDITWNNAIDGALAVSIGAFTTGWRLPNIIEMTNLWNGESSLGFNYSPLNITHTSGMWLGNTLKAATTLAWLSSTYGQIVYVAKTNAVNIRYIPCRTFTVTGTTLT